MFDGVNLSARRSVAKVESAELLELFQSEVVPISSGPFQIEPLYQAHEKTTFYFCVTYRLLKLIDIRSFSRVETVGAEEAECSKWGTSHCGVEIVREGI